MLRVSRLADFMKGVNQCVLTIRLESNVEIDGGVLGGLTQANPVVRNGIPLVLHKHVVPRRRERRVETNEERSGKDGEHKDGEQKDGEHRKPVVKHMYRGPLSLPVDT